MTASAISQLEHHGFVRSGEQADEMTPGAVLVVMRRKNLRGSDSIAQVDRFGFVNGVTVGAFLASEAPHSSVPRQASLFVA